MSLKIWDTDPNGKPQPRNRWADDVVAFVHAGMVLNNRPVSLAAWRFSTDDPNVADRLSELYGGIPESFETKKGPRTQVISSTSVLDLVVEKAQDLTACLILWGTKGAIHCCDGERFIEGHPDREQLGQLCGCPALFEERKARSRAGTGPSPQITVKARLVADEDLGYVVFRSQSWILAAAIPDIEQEIAVAADGGARVRLKLALHHVSYVNGHGKPVEYYRQEISDITAEPAAELPEVA